MNSAPKYSIVIPTRNRAHLLRHSLRCALNQTFDDYEVVVSDNDSSDETRQVLLEFPDRRIHSVRTPKTLPMPDSWEFALGKTSGEWITFLTDDSAISSRLLEKVDTCLTAMKTDVISWSHLSRYFHETWSNETERNTLTFHTYTGKAVEIPSRNLLYKWYNLIPDHTAPVSLNSFTHRRLIEKIESRAGRFFFHPCPDISSSVAMTANTPHYVYLDLPLGVNGIGKESIGMSQATSKNDAAKAFHREFQEGPVFQEVPLDLPLVANYIIESLLRVKKAFPEELRSYNIDMGLYFSHCFLSLEFLESNGVEVEAEKKEVLNMLGRQPFSVQARARWDMLQRRISLRELKNRFRIGLRKALNGSRALTALESQLRRRPEYGKTISGQEAGFSNIFEAMRCLDQRAYDQNLVR